MKYICALYKTCTDFICKGKIPLEEGPEFINVWGCPPSSYRKANCSIGKGDCYPIIYQSFVITLPDDLFVL